MLWALLRVGQGDEPSKEKELPLSRCCPIREKGDGLIGVGAVLLPLSCPLAGHGCSKAFDGEGQCQRWP